MRHVFTLATAAPLGRDSVSGEIYSSAADFDRLLAVHVRTRPGERHGLIKNIACDRLYLVLQGAGTFRIGDAEHAVAATDVVIISARDAR
jgi:mannose-6-phosphate isomerase-like protein (cupin superfamily)